MSLRSAMLQRLPAGSSSLVLVSDPDHLLADEETAVELTGRGFRLVEEDDPVLLRLRVEQSSPWSNAHPLLIVTSGELADLPFDLWHAGHHIAFNLSELLPNLSYPVIRELTPSQLSRLAASSLPTSQLGIQGTITHVLIHVFNVVPAQLSEPSELVQFLTHLHGRGERLPPRISQAVLDAITANPDLQSWPLETLLSDPESFRAFLQEQWTGFVTRQQSSSQTMEREAAFDTDEKLQDQLGLLVRTGMVEPVAVADPASLPAWSRSGVVDESDDRRLRRLALAQETLQTLLGETVEQSWRSWQQFARAWADLNAFAAGDPLATSTFELALDDAFASWLRSHYSPLATRKLPVPHHLHHVPDYLALQRRERGLARVALIVLDGLSLADWAVISDVWSDRHQNWRFHDQLLLAQVPTMTSISRQALISGLRPIDFAESLDTTAREPSRWRAFWEKQGVPESNVHYRTLALDREPEPALPVLSLTTALCLVDVSIDERVHGVTMGASELASDREVWLREYAPKLESVIQRLLGDNYAVWIASDHGHVVARGIGLPAEGVIAETRAKRARVYSDKALAEITRSSYDGALLWGEDGVLPNNRWVVLPPGRSAFHTKNDVVVTHGGATIDEMVVPFVEISMGSE